MKCGAKCFVVQMERDGKKISQEVTARTPAAARKVIRGEYGQETKIIAVKQK